MGPQWWREAVVYQMYLRSFADGNGDGVGDLVGARAHLDYVAELGVDAIWLNPWYRSPMVDAGYDVADYRAIDPSYGDLAVAEEFIAAAHDRRIRVLIDIVPNHISSVHPWFQAALQDVAGYRDLFIFRPGRGADGAEPPNNWISSFGGPAWTRLHDGAWYLHLFTPEQPDLNWGNPRVRTEFESVLRFWFDRGVDGFRIDIAHGLVKHPDLPDAPELAVLSQHTQPHPAYDQDGVHDIYRAWRLIADSYQPPRIFVAEAWVPNNRRLARYLRADELHTAFQFDFLRTPWRSDLARMVIDNVTAYADEVGAPPTWVLANHDVVRVATRYSGHQPHHLIDPWQRTHHEPVDLKLGRQRARAAALLQLALPGTAYVYQGDELGLEEFENIPNELRQDPVYHMSGHANLGRDGCRAPLPWCGKTPPFGFSDCQAKQTWLPQPDSWAPLTIAEQAADDDSMLALYRTALTLRRELFSGGQPLEWLDVGEGILAFQRGSAQCWVNFNPGPVALPDQTTPVLTSAPKDRGKILRPDTAVWLISDCPG